ncbi:MAG: FUSC family protein, partial [Pseudomonas sp.]|nr:FUSC family protein [Pseudomonas sp.]
MSHAGSHGLRHELAVWARSEGLSWIFIFKMLAAALTTLWLAMRLDMPQPSTAVMAVFIVMQPQSGQVIAKGLHRLLGTLIGLLAMLPL